MSDTTENTGDMVVLANESDARDSRLIAINNATVNEDNALAAAKVARAAARKAALAVVNKDLALEVNAAAKALYSAASDATVDLGLSLGAAGNVQKAFVGKVASAAKKMIG